MADQTKAQIPVVGIGASAGGVEALKTFFSNMPGDSGLCFVVVIHLDPTHNSRMVEILNKISEMEVVQAEDQIFIKENHIIIIPPGKAISLKGERLDVTDFKKRRGLRMPIDSFFHSLAREKKQKAAAILLSGTGTDGSRGMINIKNYGGITMVQSPESAESPQMPGNALITGAADIVKDIDDLPAELMKYVSYLKDSGNSISESDDSIKGLVAAIITLLEDQTNQSFAHYRRNTLYRRIERRMDINQISGLSEYVTLLNRDSDEVLNLFKDLLIGVTGFFRNKETWSFLKEEVLPELIGNRSPDDPLRIWVPGCSSGEEAYSISMLAQEVMQLLNSPVDIQIFATDIDFDALETARKGMYSDSIAEDVGGERLERFFSKEKDSYFANQNLRESIVFSHHNLICDPPFSKLDIISCRNLLIYLIPEIQQKVISLFHFSLKKDGFLILGNSESTGKNEELFETVNKSVKIFRKNDYNNNRLDSFPLLPSRRSKYSFGLEQIYHNTGPKREPAEIIRKSLVNEYAPVSILIDKNHKILYMHGDVEKYLKVAPGEPKNYLFNMLRKGLETRVRGAVNKAVKNNEIIRIDNAAIERDSELKKIRFDVIPVQQKKSFSGMVIISFFEHTDATEAVKQETSPDNYDVVKELENELESTKEDLHNIIEEIENNNEKLKTANEEIITMNEELQSANEELETSHEEAQSLNEELKTVNNQLQDKIGELEKSNNDLINLINNTEVPTLFINNEGMLSNFTPKAKDIFTISWQDLEKPFVNISHSIESFDLIEAVEHVNDTTEHVKEIIKTRDGRYYNCNICPYKTQDNVLDGVVITFSDITELKRKQTRIESMDAILRHTEKTAMIGSWQINLDTNDFIYSDNFLKIFKADGNRKVNDLKNFLYESIHPDEKDAFFTEWEKMLKGEETEMQFRIVTPEGNIKNLIAKGFLHTYSDDKPAALSGYIQDITIQKELEESLRDGITRLEKISSAKDKVFSVLAHDLRNPMHQIGGYLSNLKVKLSELDQKTAQERVNTSLRITQQTTRLLEELLEWASIQIRGKDFHPAGYPASTVISYVIDELQMMVEQKEIDFEVDILKSSNIFADLGHLKIIFRNIISNAIKFSSKNSTIYINGYRKADKTGISIRDTGIGMEKDRIANLFNVHSKSKTKGTENETGFGIGLMITRDLIVKNNGEILVSSELNKGTTFTVELPASGTEQQD